MKVLSLLSLFVLSLVVSCSNPSGSKNMISKVGEVNPDACALYMLNYNYADYDLSFSFELDENYDVVRVYKKINGEIERKSSFTYNETGNLAAAEVFVNDTLTGVLKFDWYSDSVIMKGNINTEGEWSSLNSLHILLNENKEIVRAEDFFADSLGDLSHYGTGYKAGWENGNMLSLDNWILKTDSVGNRIIAEDYMKDNAAVISSRAFVFANRAFFDNVEIEKFYGSTYEYDDKHNPTRTLSLAEGILPSDFNTSANNPLKMIKTYSSGETIIFNYSYIYNESDYPVKADVSVVYASGDGEEIKKAYTIDFVYKNCE